MQNKDRDKYCRPTREPRRIDICHTRPCSSPRLRRWSHWPGTRANAPPEFLVAARFRAPGIRHGHLNGWPMRLQDVCHMAPPVNRRQRPDFPGVSEIADAVSSVETKPRAQSGQVGPRLPVPAALPSRMTITATPVNVITPPMTMRQSSTSPRKRIAEATLNTGPSTVRGATLDTG